MPTLRHQLTIDFGQREMTAAGRFSAVFEIVSGAWWPIPARRADAEEAACDGDKIAEPGRNREDLPQEWQPGRLAEQIRACQQVRSLLA